MVNLIIISYTHLSDQLFFLRIQLYIFFNFVLLFQTQTDNYVLNVANVLLLNIMSMNDNELQCHRVSQSNNLNVVIYNDDDGDAENFEIPNSGHSACIEI